jgi:phasin family protein
MKSRTTRQPPRKAAPRRPVVSQEIFMPNRAKDASAYLDFAKRALAPASRFNALVTRNVEQGVKLQYAVLGDWMQLGFDQLRAVSGIEDFGSFASQQAKLANRYAEIGTRRTQDLLKAATEVQAEFAKWFEDSFEEARKAA